MVGASGFEPPPSWSRTMNPRLINNLAVGTTVAHTLLVSNYLRHIWNRDTRNREQGFYVWGGHSIGHSARDRQRSDTLTFQAVSRLLRPGGRDRGDVAGCAVGRALVLNLGGVRSRRVEIGGCSYVDGNTA